MCAIALMNIVPSREVFETLNRERRFADIHVAISHRSYMHNDGGIEHCLRRESEIAKRMGVDYLHLSAPDVVNRVSGMPTLVEVSLNDDSLGLTSVDGLAAKLISLGPSMTFLHSALGYEFGSLIRLLLSLKSIGPVLQWIHDLSFACESVTLVRDGVSCGIPVLGAIACKGCAFSSTRESTISHFDLIQKLSDYQLFP